MCKSGIGSIEPNLMSSRQWEPLCEDKVLSAALWSAFDLLELSLPYGGMVPSHPTAII